MRAIDADEFEKQVCEYCGIDCEGKGHKPMCACGYMLLIDAMPTLDVQPVINAHWTLRKDGTATCSNCNRTCGSWDYDSFDRFCRCCGATMSLKEK